MAVPCLPGATHVLGRALRTASACALDRLRGKSTLNLIFRSPLALGVLLMGMPSPRTSWTESGPTTYAPTLSGVVKHLGRPATA